MIDAFGEGTTVGSYQMTPPTTAPFNVRGEGVSESSKTIYDVCISLTREQAQKLCQDWIKMGLFGAHGRVVQTKAAG